MDEFVVCYLDDILIYWEDPAQHEDHVRKVLERLREYGLYCKAEKCEFSVKKVGFLGFVVSPDGIEMEADRIATIEDWPTPKSVKDCHGVGRDINVQCVLIKEMIIIVDHYTLAVRNRR
jgi:hypothetical protein